jgi:hypothetical protein
MIHCKELSDKVVRFVTIYEDGTYGPEVHIEFTDGTTFSACLKTNVSIEAKYPRSRRRTFYSSGLLYAGNSALRRRYGLPRRVETTSKRQRRS